MVRDENGLTPLQAAFVREYVLSLNASDAYKKAGYKVKNDRVATVESCRLLASPSIKAVVSRIQSVDKIRQGQQDRKTIITRREILEGLKGIAVDIDAPHSARIRAYELMGKHKGLFKDRSQIPGIPDTDAPEEAEVNVFEYIRVIAARIRTCRLAGGDVTGNGHVEQVDHPETNGQADPGASSG